MLPRLISANWLKISRYWLSWTLLALLVALVALQINGKLQDLADLEKEVATGVSSPGGAPLTPEQLEGNRYLIATLRAELSYPTFISYALRVATGSGWFLLIVFVAVLGGEDFARRTLRSFLARGVGRARFILADCAALWGASGVAVALIALLAAAIGPYVHSQVTDEPLALVGLGQVLLVVLRVWLTCLPFVAATLFWTVLARQAGPALGVGVSLHFIEVGLSVSLPLFLVMYTAAGQQPPFFLRWQGNVLAVMLGYNADVFLHWGPPGVISPQLFDTLSGLSGRSVIPTDPWRATAFLAGYVLVFLVLAALLLRRRDVTGGGG